MTHQEEYDQPVSEEEEAWGRISCQVNGINPDDNYVWEVDGVDVAKGPAWRAALLVRHTKSSWLHD